MNLTDNAENSIVTEPTKRIHKNAIKAWKISAILWGCLLYLVPGFLYFLTEIHVPISILFPIIIAPITVVVHILLIVFYPKIRWRRWKYDVNELGIDMQRGIFITKRTVVPINRVQHVDTRQGPVYRKYGLSSISLSTAATTHEIPALDVETATELRGIISELVRKVKEDV